MRRRASILLAVATVLGCQARDPVAPLEPPPATPSPGAPAPIRAGPAPEAFSVIAVGDVMLGKVARAFIRKEGLDYPFSRVRQEIEKHDIAFANLEGPISDRGVEKMKKVYTLRVGPAEGRALARSGIDVVGLANNHMMDFGEEALGDTLAHLDEWSIARVGAGEDLASAREPARLEAGGTSVVILAYCAWAPAPIHAREDRAGVSPLDRDLILEDVRRHSRAGSVVLVSLHWGVQHTDRATSGQVRLARDIIDAGASAILGHHPHRPQEVEVYGGRPIVYSLGNFLFGYYNKAYRDNIALVLSFEGSALVGARILAVAGRNGQTRFQPRFLDGDEGQDVLRHVARLSSRFGTRMTLGAGEAQVHLEPGP